MNKSVKENNNYVSYVPLGSGKTSVVYISVEDEVLLYWGGGGGGQGGQNLPPPVPLPPASRPFSRFSRPRVN